MFILKYMHRKPFPCMSQNFSIYTGLCSGSHWAQQMLDFHVIWWRSAGLREYLIASSYCRGRKETSSVLSVIGGAICSHTLLHIRSITWRRDGRDIPKWGKSSVKDHTSLSEIRVWHERQTSVVRSMLDSGPCEAASNVNFPISASTHSLLALFLLPLLLQSVWV